jgi:hypothetical protein
LIYINRINNKLPVGMENNLNQNIGNNPEFKYYLYDDVMCIDFLINKFKRYISIIIIYLKN